MRIIFSPLRAGHCLVAPALYNKEAFWILNCESKNAPRENPLIVQHA